MPTGIRDRVAILGMGCSKFGERWDCDLEDLIVEAYVEAITDAEIERGQVEAAWFSAALEEPHIGKSGVPLAVALRLPYIPVTFCAASGSEAFRGACYAVASGACDIALAVGCEKLKDIGYGGLPQSSRSSVNAMYWANLSSPGGFAQLATAYRARHRINNCDFDHAMAHIAVKSHQNGSRNSKAHLRNPISIDQVLNAPIVAEPLRLFHCCGVSDGATCAIVATPEIARVRHNGDVVSVKALELAVSNGVEAQYGSWDGSYIATTRIAAKRAYESAGITRPREEIDLIEAHDCFSIAELVTMEDLYISEEGRAAHDVMDGFFDADGSIPCQIDGGLKCFGHPIGASGLRMLYEIYLQVQGRADGRQRAQQPVRGLAHNLGGFPHLNACSIAIIGALGA
jgi:acetyl-CoA C-acetyltransferase